MVEIPIEWLAWLFTRGLGFVAILREPVFPVENPSGYRMKDGNVPKLCSIQALSASPLGAA